MGAARSTFEYTWSATRLFSHHAESSEKSVTVPGSWCAATAAERAVQFGVVVRRMDETRRRGLGSWEPRCGRPPHHCSAPMGFGTSARSGHACHAVYCVPTMRSLTYVLPSYSP